MWYVKKIQPYWHLHNNSFIKKMNSNIFQTKVEWWKNMHTSNKQKIKERHKDNKECEEIKQKNKNVRVW